MEFIRPTKSKILTFTVTLIAIWLGWWLGDKFALGMLMTFDPEYMTQITEAMKPAMQQFSPPVVPSSFWLAYVGRIMILATTVYLGVCIVSAMNAALNEKSNNTLESDAE